MRKRAGLILAVAALTLVAPAPAGAWGFAGHRLITARALDLLPPPLRSFYQQFHDEVVMRSIDPDLWRNVGWEEDPNHFVDFGMRELGPYPFAALPRDYGAALEKFGIDLLRKIGMLP